MKLNISINLFYSLTVISITCVKKGRNFTNSLKFITILILRCSVVAVHVNRSFGLTLNYNILKYCLT